MGLLVLLIVGAIVGYLASIVMRRNEGILGSVVIGIVGAFIGRFLDRLLTGSEEPFLTLDGGSFLWDLVGAVVLCGVLNYIQRKEVR